MLASWTSGLEPDERYPFGRGAVIPVAILIQGAALMATLAYAGFDSVSLILAGGSDGAPLSVVGYGLVTLVIAIGITIALPRVAPGSELAAAEAAQWRAGAVLSGLIAVGAAAAAVADAAGLHQVVPTPTRPLSCWRWP